MRNEELGIRNSVLTELPKLPELPENAITITQL